jgi:hypothetical protein
MKPIAYSICLAVWLGVKLMLEAVFVFGAALRPYRSGADVPDIWRRGSYHAGRTAARHD